MPGLFQINGAAIGQALTPPLPDPVTGVWFDEGEMGRTHSGRLVSLAKSGIRLVWDPLYAFQYEALLDFWKGLAAAGFKVTSLTVPVEEGYDTTGATYWKLYTAVDERGIWPEKPTGTPHGIGMEDVVWIFKNVKPAVA